MLARTLTVALFLSGAAVLLALAPAREVTPLRAPLSDLPFTIGAWHGRPDVDLDEEVLRVLRTDEYVNRVYERDGSVLSLYLGYYGSQREGAKIHSPRHCLPGAGWVPVATGRLTLQSTTSNPIEVNRYIVQKGSDRQIAVFWYEGRGRSIAGEYQQRVAMLWDALRTGRTDGALVRVLAPVRGNDAAAERTVIEFSEALHARLHVHLPR